MTTPSKVRTRFAPSPTGFLHIGGARTALFNWLFARHHGGVFVLRIEDTDEVRSTHESVDAILDSLRWLGIPWDEGPETLEKDRGPYAPYFQMKRIDSYRAFARKLLQEGRAYPCYCTKEELDAMRRLAQLEKRPPRYDGRCRDLTDEKRREFEAAGKKAVLRFRMPDEGTTAVPDLIRGNVQFENALLQDFVILKASGVPTYNFACVIDDHAMEISHVIRGSSPRMTSPSQLQLYAALGFEPPAFAHLSMILGPDGAKLSKRHGATSVLEYRDQGYYPKALRNYLALLGWATSESQELFEEEELFRKFSIEGCQKSPASFDPAKLLWMDGEYLRKLPAPELLAAARPFLEKAGLWGKPGLEQVAALEREKYKLLSDVPKLLDFFFKDSLDWTDKAQKLVAADGPRALLGELAAELSRLPSFAAKPLEEAIRGFCAARSLKTSQVFHPLRAAVSGRTEGPSLFEMLAALGREKVIARLRQAAATPGPLAR